MTSAPTAAVAGGDEREYRFGQKHFEILRDLAKEEVGIELADGKRELVYGRLARRVRALGLEGFDAYCNLVTQEGSPERVNFVNAITTNVTSFFREAHHFEHLRDEALPALMTHRKSNRRLRIWSAACSTGQEPYSIAMTLTGVVPSQGWDSKILATDIDSSVVARAEAGVYPTTDVPDLDQPWHGTRWFRPAPGGDGTTVQIDDALRSMCHFRVLNLMDPWLMSGPLDIIFCRNVLIYFSKDTQRQLVRRLAEILAPDGYLFIGHSESMLHSADLFELVGRTTYQLRAGS